MHTFALVLFLMAIQTGQILSMPTQDAIKQLAVGLESHGVTKRSISSSTCLDYLYVMAFTSGVTNAETAHRHAVEIDAAGETRKAELPDNPANDAEKHKGDLWKMSFAGDFSFSTCITIDDIDEIAIEEDGTDGWNIASIVTFLVADGCYELATVDLDINQWIDDNGNPNHERYELTLLI